MNGQGVIALAFLLAVVSQAQGQGRGVPGGLSEQQMAGPGEQALVAKSRKEIIRRLPSWFDRPVGPFKALTYRTQTVAGTNYFIKVKIQEPRPRFIHVRIYATLNNRSKVAGVKVARQYDPILYF
uniref:Cystatin-A n=1 Tax=Magallana gigas TaxID=29159 RepID=K1PA11_MAGGI|eukprot:XP_011445117.1 PREDICTED: cystatin-A [Crassostrea gigas]